MDARASLEFREIPLPRVYVYVHNLKFKFRSTARSVRCYPFDFYDALVRSFGAFAVVACSRFDYAFKSRFKIHLRL